jgi:hypothetical protein
MGIADSYGVGAGFVQALIMRTHLAVEQENRSDAHANAATYLCQPGYVLDRKRSRSSVSAFLECPQLISSPFDR